MRWQPQSPLCRREGEEEEEEEEEEMVEVADKDET